jgi:hypothetical protein
MPQPEIPNAFADPLVILNHSEETASSPEETIGRRLMATERAIRNALFIGQFAVIVVLMGVLCSIVSIKLEQPARASEAFSRRTSIVPQSFPIREPDVDQNQKARSSSR